MKHILLLMLCASTSLIGLAQLPEYGVAPDFTVTDVNGNTHNLYSILDQGKPVVIDMFATWCPSCWSYHQTHAMEDLWTQYGDPGTGELFVMSIESQPGNTMDQLNGIPGNPGNTYTTATEGDWLDGITHPVADDHLPADTFNAPYMPTIYTVCPDRSVFESGMKSPSQHYALASGCNGVASVSNDANMLAYAGETSTCGVLAMKAVIQNKGTQNLTSATVKIMDGSTEMASVNWTGDLGTYEYDEVDFGSVNIQPGSYTIEITTSDDNPSNNSISVNLTAAPVATLDVTVKVTTDIFAGETSWALTSSDGTVVASDQYQTGPGQAGDGGPDAAMTHTYPVSLVINECYTMTLEDSYGDGMAYYYTGNEPLDYGYEIVDPWGGVILSHDGDFEYETIGAMKTDASSGIEDNEDLISSLNLYPNPTIDNTVISFESKGSATIRLEVVNALGSMVIMKDFGTKSAGTQIIPLSTSELTGGVYLVNLYVNDSVTTKRLSIEK